MAPNIKKPSRFKQVEQFEPVQPNRKCPPELSFRSSWLTLVGKQRSTAVAQETHKPVRRSARLRERKLNEEVSKPNKALRPPLERAKTRASRKPKQPQPNRQKNRRQKGL